jgi:hypothetical protein
MRSTTALLAVTLLAGASCRPALAAPERAARRGPAAIELVDEAGALLPTFEHRGRTYVLGVKGQRYLLRFRNATGRRVEVVASVDGRDVVDGRPASAAKRGYVVEPYGELTIDGFRLSDAAVAAFRFSSVPRSYAAQMGDARDVGVIGVAIFRERWVPPPRRPLPNGAPSDDAYGPEARSERSESKGGAAPAPSAAPSLDGRRADRGLARPGLGTEFGEEHGSLVQPVAFERASARPDAVLSLRYDDRDGLLALGVDIDGRYARGDDDAWLRETATPFRRDGFARPPPGWLP